MKKTDILRGIMQSGLVIFLLFLSGCSLFNAQSASERTEHTAFYTCGGCHGPENVRVEFMMTPKIIGQKQSYLAQKLRDFRDGKRVHPFMNGVSEVLSDEEIINLSNYYANYEQNNN